MDTIPWVEKYRPNSFENIIINEYDKQLLNSLLPTDIHYPMIFYGRPGTGKTTTILNFINKYQECNNGKTVKENILHMNASDESGINVIRQKINVFINTKTLFNNSRKFVVLDEVDYMNINSQIILYNIIETCMLNSPPDINVSFFLLCNYISKIYTPIVDTCITIKFGFYNESEIYSYVLDIFKKENITINNKLLHFTKDIIYKYKPDIRMILNQIQNMNYKTITFKTHNMLETLLYEIYYMVEYLNNEHNFTLIQVQNIIEIYKKSITEILFEIKYEEVINITIDFVYDYIKLHDFSYTQIKKILQFKKNTQAYNSDSDIILTDELLYMIIHLIHNIIKN